MDGWMDGVLSHLDALQTPISVDLRRVLDGFCNRPVIDELLCEQCWI